jgi:hypothetical protein
VKEKLEWEAKRSRLEQEEQIEAAQDSLGTIMVDGDTLISTREPGRMDEQVDWEESDVLPGRSTQSAVPDSSQEVYEEEESN